MNCMVLLSMFGSLHNNLESRNLKSDSLRPTIDCIDVGKYLFLQLMRQEPGRGITIKALPTLCMKMTQSRTRAHSIAAQICITSLCYSNVDNKTQLSWFCLANLLTNVPYKIFNHVNDNALGVTLPIFYLFNKPADLVARNETGAAQMRQLMGANTVMW